MNIHCIYIITSIIKPCRSYIGATTNFTKRKCDHLRFLRYGYHHNIKLQYHVDKYGIDDLTFEILETVKGPDFLEEREQFYLDKHTPFFNVYKTAILIFGRKRSDEFREAQRQRMLGQKRAIGKRTLESCQKMSQSQMGNKNWLGKKHSEDSKKKMSESQKGHTHTEEARAKISKASLLRKHTPETILKMKEVKRLWWANKKAV